MPITDDWVKVPKTVVLGVVLAVPASIIASTLWVAGQESGMATLAGKVDGLVQAVREVRGVIEQREAEQALRYRQVDETAQKLDLRLTKIETALSIAYPDGQGRKGPVTR